MEENRDNGSDGNDGNYANYGNYGEDGSDGSDEILDMNDVEFQHLIDSEPNSDDVSSNEEPDTSDNNNNNDNQIINMDSASLKASVISPEFKQQIGSLLISFDKIVKDSNSPMVLLQIFEVIKTFGDLFIGWWDVRGLLRQWYFIDDCNGFSKIVELLNKIPQQTRFIISGMIGVLIGPVKHRRKFVEVGLNWLLEQIQKKNNISPTLFWLTENLFELDEHQVELFSPQIYQKSIELANARLNHVPAENDDEEDEVYIDFMNAIGVLLISSANPELQNYLMEQNVVPLLNACFENKTMKIQEKVWTAITVSNLSLKYLKEILQATQFDKKLIQILKELPLHKGGKEIGKMLKGENSIWASIEPFANLVNSPLISVQILGMTYLCYFATRPDEFEEMISSNVISKIILFSWNQFKDKEVEDLKGKTELETNCVETNPRLILKFLAKDALKNFSNVQKNAPTLVEICKYYLQQDEKINYEEIMKLPLDILEKYPELHLLKEK